MSHAVRNLPPINVVFLYMERRTPVNIWLAEQVHVRIHGIIDGFDEFMNVVLSDACEIEANSENKRDLGSIMLKGDCITLISSINP